MAQMVGKGCVLQVNIASTLTTIAQLISFEITGVEAETYEADTLDNSNAGIPYAPTGRVEGGSVNFEGFLDPVGATFQALTDLLLTPATTAFNITWTDAADTDLPFSVAGVSIGAAVVLNDGVKFSGSLKLNGQPTWPS